MPHSSTSQWTRLFTRRIRSDERVLFVGKTGSGKTYLARYLTAPVPRLVVCDPKGRINSEEWRLRPYDDALRDLQDGKPARARIAPQYAEEDWEPFFWQLLGIGNCIIYIDELYGVGPSKGSRGLQALYTRGRELGIGVWSATQRPTFIPIYARSEAEWVFQFQLNIFEDRERMYQTIGKKAFTKLHDHQFIGYNDDMREPVLCNRLVVG